MTMTDFDNDIVARADRLYAARSALAEASPAQRRLGIADIVQFLNDPGRSLSIEEQRALFADPRLRADYRRLKTQAAVAQIPMSAAASAGEVTSRRFEGGSLSIHPSRVPGQVYVRLQFSWPAGSPRSLLIESNSGEIVKRCLPSADPQGEVMIVLDEKIPSDAGFLRLISDPTSTGTFLL